ncbi:MAG TPA: SDR family oxidoreductase [Micromonosporaceae bacterium]
MDADDLRDRVALVRALGPAWVRDGIRVNALCPGFTDTPMVEPLRARWRTRVRH